MALHPETSGAVASGQIQSGQIQSLVAMLDSVTLRQGLVIRNELAIALWRAGEIDTAIGLLDQALSSLGPATQCDWMR